MASKKILKLSAALIFIAGTGIFCLSGKTPFDPANAEYLFGARVELSQGKFSVDSTELKIPVTAQDLMMLDYFPNLKSVDFSGSSCYDDIALWAAANPQVDVRYSIALPDGSTADNHTETLDLSWLENDDVSATARALENLCAVKSIKLGTVGSDSLALGALIELRAAAPNAEFDFSVEIMGQQLSPNAESIDLSGLSSAEVTDTVAVLSCMPNLKTVELGSQSAGSNLEWTDIAALKAAAPDAKFSYSFNLYGQELTLDSETLDFRGTAIEDEAKLLYSVLPCMNNCKSLDMDSTGVSNETLAELRGLFPNIDIVWRIWFGENYSVRTDVERILASKPSVGGDITDASVLQYCTKLKYLDIGHNYNLSDFSFLANMPELEILIVAMCDLSDISALANCTKLEYLELNSTKVSDLSPLANCTGIKHLNIGSCPNITDMSPLFSITGMERLWIGKETPVPAEQIEKMRSIAPNCTINTTVTDDPTGEAWRYTGYDPDIPLYHWVPRYELLRNQLGYNYQEYSFYWLDPLCDIPAPAQHAGKYGKEVYGL